MMMVVSIVATCAFYTCIVREGDTRIFSPILLPVVEVSAYSKPPVSGEYAEFVWNTRVAATLLHVHVTKSPT